MAWPLDRSITTAETAARRPYRLDDELSMICEKWSLSNFSANAGKGKAVVRAPSAVVKPALRTAQQEAKRLLRER